MGNYSIDDFVLITRNGSDIFIWIVVPNTRANIALNTLSGFLFQFEELHAIGTLIKEMAEQSRTRMTFYVSENRTVSVNAIQVTGLNVPPLGAILVLSRHMNLGSCTATSSLYAPSPS